MPMPILILTFIAAQIAAAAALSLRVESLTVMRPSALSANTLSIGEIVALRIRNVVFSARRVQQIYARITSG